MEELPELGSILTHYDPSQLFFQLAEIVDERTYLRHTACVAHPFGLGACDGPVEMTFYPRAAAMSGAYADPHRDRSAIRTYVLNSGRSEEETDAAIEDLLSGEPVTAELRRLSSVVRDERIERIDLLKIDVERAEADVLAGIEEAHWPLIHQLVAEVHDDGGRLARLTAALEGRGFEVIATQDRAWRGTGIHMLYARMG